MYVFQVGSVIFALEDCIVSLLCLVAWCAQVRIFLLVRAVARRASFAYE